METTMAGILRANLRQTASYAFESGLRKVNPPPWKKRITGRLTSVVVGVKRRNQSFRAGSMVTSEDLTPLMGVELGGVLKSTRLTRRRLTVPSVRREASVTAERMDTKILVFHGRTGDVCSGEFVISGFLKMGNGRCIKKSV